MYRLLVVDDEKDIRENIRYLIDWSRYGINQIETAATYEEAVNKALDMVRLFSIIGIVIIICMIVLGKLISRINISQALKLGED